MTLSSIRRPQLLRKLAIVALVLGTLGLFSSEASAYQGRGWRGGGYYHRGYGGFYGPRFYNRGYGGFYGPRIYNRGYGGYYGGYAYRPYIYPPYYSFPPYYYGGGGFGYGYGLGGFYGFPF